MFTILVTVVLDFWPGASLLGMRPVSGSSTLLLPGSLTAIFGEKCEWRPEMGVSFTFQEISLHTRFPSLGSRSISCYWPIIGCGPGSECVTCRCGLGPPQISVPFPEIFINYQPQRSSLDDSLFLLKTLAKAFLKGALRLDLLTPFDSLNVLRFWL